MKTEQIWDSAWNAFGSSFYLQCCECGLVHRVKLRKKNNRFQIQFTKDTRKTAATRRELRKTHYA